MSVLNPIVINFGHFSRIASAPASEHEHSPGKRAINRDFPTFP
jgi:hypothetical protein